MDHGKTLELIIREIAEKHNLTIPQVEHIIDSQFRFINNQIESEEYKTVSVMYLGKFTPNGLHKYKAEGRYKRGKFINAKKSEGNNSGVVELLPEQGDTSGEAANSDL
jgi:hypothetical protein